MMPLAANFRCEVGPGLDIPLIYYDLAKTLTIIPIDHVHYLHPHFSTQSFNNHQSSFPSLALRPPSFFCARPTRYISEVPAQNHVDNALLSAYALQSL